MKRYPGLTIIDAPFEGSRHIHICLFGEDRPVLVDTGVAGVPTATILPAMEEMGVGAGDLRMVINLHAHADHIGGNGEVFAASGESVPFGAHAADAPAIEDHVLLARCGAHVPVQRIFRGGEVVAVDGQRVRVIHAPGHTAGNLALYEESHRVLLHGESVMGPPQEDANGLLSTPFGNDPTLYRGTLTALAALPFEVFVPSHAPVLDRSAGLAEIQVSLAGLDAWEACCRAALQHGADSLAALAAAVAAEGRYAPGPRLERQVAAWVAEEVRAGRALREADGAVRIA